MYIIVYQRVLSIVVLYIFIAKHLRINLAVKSIKTSLILSESAFVVLIVLLR